MTLMTFQSQNKVVLLGVKSSFTGGEGGLMTLASFDEEF